MAVPWTQILRWAPEIIGISRDLLQRAKGLPPATELARAEDTEQLAVRIAALEENERRQAELIERMAEQQAELTRAVLELHRRERILFGALVVVEGIDRVVGIVSERDIVKALARKGGAVLDDPVGTIMTREVVTCADDETVIRVMGRMTRGRFRHVPVVDGERCVAVISIVDIVKHRVAEIEFEHEALHSYIARTV